MNVPEVVVFTYDFPHKKTQDILLRLFLEDIDIQTVLGAPWKDLDIPSSEIRGKVRHKALVEPEQVAERIDASYRTIEHDGDEILDVLDEIDPNLGIIAGARILDQPVIDRFEKGIVNFHPGLIPEARGLDALLWSIHKDVPPGVTAHLVDERVDAGEILERRRIDVYEDDTLLDLNERLYETELEIVRPSLEAAATGDVEKVVSEDTEYRSRMPGDLQRETADSVREYVERYANQPA